MQDFVELFFYLEGGWKRLGMNNKNLDWGRGNTYYKILNKSAFRYLFAYKL